MPMTRRNPILSGVHCLVIIDLRLGSLEAELAATRKRLERNQPVK